MATSISDGFQHPLGNGATTPEDDGDGYYVYFDYALPNNDIGGYYHLGEDWNVEGAAWDDFQEPVYSISNGQIRFVNTDPSHVLDSLSSFDMTYHQDLSLLNHSRQKPNHYMAAVARVVL